MPDTWLTTTAVRSTYFPELCRKAVWAKLVRWRARNFPAVREQPRGVGGVELAVRQVELEAHLGLIPCAA